MTAAKSAGSAEPVITKVVKGGLTKSASVARAAALPRTMPESFYSEPDPAQREAAWIAVYGPMIAKGR